MTKQNPPGGKTGRAGKLGKVVEDLRSSTRPAQNPVAAEAMMAARLAYAARGWPTFPAPADGTKKSLKWATEGNGWSRWGATLDPEAIAREFRSSRRLRDQNIGIVTGQQSGIFVIESDTAEHGDGIDGEAVLYHLEKKFGALPKTLTAESPSGSVHLYFRHPGPGVTVRSFAHIFGPNSGVDCKGDGGMILGPPSVRPPMPAKDGKPAKRGGVYRWVNNARIAKAPRWLIDIVIEKPREARTTPAKTTEQKKLAERPANVALIRFALAQIPADVHYDDWMSVGAALYNEFAGSDLGLELFIDWSTSIFEYRHAHGDCERKWLEFEKYQNITIGSLFWLAEKHRPRWRAVYEAKCLEATASFFKKQISRASS